MILHSNLLRLIAYNRFTEGYISGEFNKIQIFVEFYEHDLDEEIDTRILNQDHFKEEELWYLIFAIISALKHFQLFNVIHGDIRPKNIFLTPYGQAKLADNGVLNSLPNAYSKAIKA